MRRLRWLALSSLCGLTGALLLPAPPADCQEMIQFGFEGRDTVWVQGESKASFREIAHRITDDHARSGSRSEHIQLQVEQGEFIHYTYNVGRAPVTDELTASVFVRATRPGVQLLARVVLPQERDPENLAQPLTVILGGDSYLHTSRWQQLGIRQPVKRLNEKLALLREKHKRPDFNLNGAYVDRLILNVCCGPGQIDVYIDDLEVGPVLDAKQAGPTPGMTTGRTTEPTTPTAPTNRRAAVVELKGNPQQLFVADGQKLFMRGIRHTGTPLKTLSDALFNVIWIDENAPPGLLEDAANLGFWLVPSLKPPGLSKPGEATLTANEAFGKKVARFLNNEAVLIWDLGNDQELEQAATVARIARAFRTADPMRPLIVDVRYGFQRYAHGIDSQLMIGAHKWPLMTSMELLAYRDWLMQCRALTGRDAFCWTWIQTHLPDWFMTVAYDRTADGGFTEPIGPQAEQIRLMTFLAIGSGYRGVAYWSDRFLADSHTGRDRLLALALLNHQLKLLEPILVDVEEPEWIDTSDPNVKAAVLRPRKKPTVLVLPIWVGKGSQFVPGQAAVPSLTIKVPAVPLGCQAWEVSPGRVQSLKWTRKLGGNEIVLKEFCLSSAIVFTSDLTGLVVKCQKDQKEMAQSAAQWAYDQAQEELAKVERVHAELEQMGQKVDSSDVLLNKARDYLTSSLSSRRAGDYGEGYAEAERALRPIRILMRKDWEKAVKPLEGLAVASPYAVSYYTLPRHWRFWDQVTSQRVAANVLPDGDFELPMDRVPDGWLLQEVPSLDNTVGAARRVAEGAKEGKQCLKMEVKPRDPLTAAAVLERTYLAIHSPSVRLQPGTLVRVSAWVKIPTAITGSPDGVLLFDSSGGEALAVRLTAAQDWKKVTLYRKVPASGAINVSLALTGLGTAYFDDVRIEPLVPAGTTTAAADRGK
jgi:hypothetical protein